jgi:hypothetical protein
MTKITATPNRQKRTFTIRKYINGQLVSKYRTTQMSKPEFEEHEYNTEDDWKAFFKKESYTLIK